MTLKTLVTGVAAVAAVGGAAVGVTSLASSTITAAPAVQPVVWDIPMPLAPEDDLVGPLTQTVNTLGSGGSFSGKSAYIQGLGRFTGKGVELKYNDAVAKGYLPLTAIRCRRRSQPRRGHRQRHRDPGLRRGPFDAADLRTGSEPDRLAAVQPVALRPRRTGGIDLPPYSIPERRHRIGGGVRALRVRQPATPCRAGDADDERRGIRGAGVVAASCARGAHRRSQQAVRSRRARRRQGGPCRIGDTR